jgi:hypothetical protein
VQELRRLILFYSSLITLNKLAAKVSFLFFIS